MMNIILILIFIHQLIHFVKKKKPGILCCGLFGFCGTEKANPDKLKILALYNMSRGRQATGICVDDQITKDLIPSDEFIEKHQHPFDFYQEGYDVINRVVIGHCRQASAAYNATSLKEVHPHKTTKGGKDFLRLTHNGTIQNCYDLGHKYELEHLGKSDSMLLAEIITKTWDAKKLDILKDYKGAATIVFYPVGMKNVLFVHRDTDRELFYWQETENSFYYSSIKKSLVAIGAESTEIVEFEPGILYKIANGVVANKWPFKDKKPYEKPRPAVVPKTTKTPIHIGNLLKNSKHNNTNEVCSINGFAWVDFVLKYNNHRYTGDLYVNKETKDGLRCLGKDDKKEDYDHFHVVNGHIMRDADKAAELVKKCTPKDPKEAFDHEIFNSILPSQLQNYTMFPVIAKIYSNEPGDIFFWSPEIQKIEHPNTYEWTLPMGREIYCVNRIGQLVTTKIIPAKSNGGLKEKEIIELCINRKIAQKKIYNNVRELMSDFNDYRYDPTNVPKVLQPANYAEIFLKALLEYFKECPQISRKLLSDLNLKISDEYWTSRNNHTDIFDSFENPLDLVQSSLSLTAYDSIDPDEGLAGNPNENDYNDSQEFKNAVLFGDYDNFDNLLENYAPSQDKRPCLIAIANIFKEIGLLDWDKIEFIRKSDFVAAKSRVEDIYLTIKSYDDVKIISSIFDDNPNPTKDFVHFYNEYITLEAKQGLDKNEETKFEILKMGLSYMIKNTQINRTTLVTEYDITNRELESISC